MTLGQHGLAGLPRGAAHSAPPLLGQRTGLRLSGILSGKPPPVLSCRSGLTSRQIYRRRPAPVVAHGNHSQGHSPNHDEAWEHSDSDREAHSRAHSHGEKSHYDHKADGPSSGSSSGAPQQSSAVCGHDHGERDANNPAHRALDWLYGALRLSGLAAWLEDSVPATLAKIALLLLAAGASWAAGGPAGGALAPFWPQVASGALAGAYFFAGVPAIVDLSYDLTSGNIDTHVLMTLAALGTVLTGHALEGALLLVLFQTSHVVEHQLTAAAQGNLSALYDSIPREAVLVDLAPDGSPAMASARRVPAGGVAVGQLLLVKPGEAVPLDGSIVHGRALVSSEHITGESLPVLRQPGDEVPAGALNRDGMLVVRAARRAEESTPARIAALALSAQAERPQLRTWLDGFGAAYSKAVIAASAVALAALLLGGVPLLGSGAQRGAFYRAMGFLTVASPCALVMVPLAYVSAIAAISSRGVLLKGARVLDALAGCRSVAFDKTGTLTTGALVCTSMRPLGGGARGRQADAGAGLDRRREALEAAVALSLRSSHPVSDAVVLHGERSGLGPAGSADVGVADFTLVAGGGVRGRITSSSSRNNGGGSSSGRPALFGSSDFVEEQLTPEEREAVRRLSAGRRSATSVTSLLVLGGPEADSAAAAAAGDGAAVAGRSVWVLTFEDSVREQSAAAIHALQTGSWTGRPSPEDAVSVTMLTGDNEASAARVARKLGIASVAASLSPEQKLAAVRRLRAEGGGAVAMVGDGLNDAAALAVADVGVAIASTASAAAALAADVIVINGSGVAALPLLLRVARDVRSVVRLNLALAFGSILALALPTVLGVVPLWLAVMLHEGSTLLVALNSLRLLRHSAGIAALSSSSSSSAGGGSWGQPAIQVSAEAAAIVATA